MFKKDNFTFGDAHYIVDEVARLAKWFIQIIADLVNGFKEDDGEVIEALEAFEDAI